MATYGFRYKSSESIKPHLWFPIRIFIGNHKRAILVSETNTVKPLSHTYGFSYIIYVGYNMNKYACDKYKRQK
jgi:hypothetical protein